MCGCDVCVMRATRLRFCPGFNSPQPLIATSFQRPDHAFDVLVGWTWGGQQIFFSRCQTAKRCSQVQAFQSLFIFQFGCCRVCPERDTFFPQLCHTDMRGTTGACPKPNVERWECWDCAPNGCDLVVRVNHDKPLKSTSESLDVFRTSHFYSQVSPLRGLTLILGPGFCKRLTGS